MTEVSRRRLLALGGSTLMLAPLGRVGAQPVGLAPVRREVLRVPNFSVALKPSEMAARVRPHRLSGIRLESEPEASTSAGPRFLIHNYGHSGAGVTLSWGSAKRVADVEVPKALAALRGTTTRPSIAVIGSGVIGLTTADTLRRKYPAVPIKIYAKETDVARTTSFVAAGQFEPSLLWRIYEQPAEQALLGELLLGTREWIARIIRAGTRTSYGVAERRNYMLEAGRTSLIPDNGLDYAYARGALACLNETDTACAAAMRSGGYNRGTLPFAALNTQPGREYFTWLINPRVLLPKLVAELRAAKVQIVRRNFLDRAQVLALSETIIINCTGYGARALFCDRDLVPRRGHIVTIRNPQPDQMRWFFSGGCANQTVAYVFCRQSDIVVGGTVIYDNSDDRDSAAEFDREDAMICRQLMVNAQNLLHNGVIACPEPVSRFDTVSSTAGRPADPLARCGL